MVCRIVDRKKKWTFLTYMYDVHELKQFASDFCIFIKTKFVCESKRL